MNYKVMFFVTGALTAVLTGCNPSNDVAELRILNISELDQPLLADGSFTVEFSEPVDVSTLELNVPESFSSIADFSWNSTRTTVTVSPEIHWPGGNYEFSITAISDDDSSVTSETLSVIVNLSFDAFQEADNLINVGNSPYHNATVYQGDLWFSIYDEGIIYQFDGIPENFETLPQQTIESIESVDGEEVVQSYSLEGPQVAFIANDQLVTADYDDDVVYIYNNIPTQGSTNLGLIIGASSFEDDMSGIEYCSAQRLNSPEQAIVAGNKLVVADSLNNRVLIWNSIPNLDGQLPDIVLGQNTFDSCAENDEDQTGDDQYLPTDRTLAYPSGLWSDGERLIVVDGNNRVLIWNTFPESNFAAADIVLGQPDFQSNFENDDAGDLSEDDPSARTLNNAYEGVTSNGRQIYVADSSNNRVLIWNEWPTSNYEPADQVLGQINFSNINENDADQDGIEDEIIPESNSVLNSPVGVVVYANRLIVTGNSDDALYVFTSN